MTPAENKELSTALDRIPSSFDRFEEAHFWIHNMETYYHFSSQFRWQFNAYLKALKEVPQLLQTELQNEPRFTEWFRAQRDLLNSDPLMAFLSKQRDIVVHRSMLVPDSRCVVGITELRGMKLGFSLNMDPLEDSDHAMQRYLYTAAERGDFLGLLTPDEDSIPCVQRVWRFSGLDDEIISLCAKAWLRTGKTIADVLRWLGVEPPPLSLDCRHGDQKVQFKLFSRDALGEQLRALRKETG